MKTVLRSLLALLLLIPLAGQSGCPSSPVPNTGQTDDTTTDDGSGSTNTSDQDSDCGCANDEYSAGIERIGVLQSTDGGANWTFVGHACFHAPTLTPVDPSPIFENGQIVLYFYDITGAMEDSEKPRNMYRATSTDGLEFTEPTLAFSSEEWLVTDPDVIHLPDGRFRMYLSEGNQAPSAISTDGITFTAEEGYRSESGGVPGILQLADGRYRLFVCGDGIVSLISEDGVTFVDETGARIASPEGGDVVCDPDPIALKNGGYLMTYKLRPSDAQGPTSDAVYLATSDDGLTWTTLGDSPYFGSVPGIVELDDGTLLIYFVDFNYEGSEPSGDEASGDDQQAENPEQDPPTDVSDFVPATGADTSDLAPRGRGVANQRLRIATSADGVSWTRADTTLSDQASEPSALVVDSKLWVFYVMWRDADDTPELRNQVVAAYTTNLTTWTYKKLIFSGDFPDGFAARPSMPSVVATDSGYRMYFVLGPDDPSSSELPAVFSATSTDLLNWTYEGDCYASNDYTVTDPSVLWTGSQYDLFGLGHPQVNHHATSTDGVNFTEQEGFSATSDSGMPIVLSNGIQIGTSYKYYGYTSVPDDSGEYEEIHSLSSADGLLWGVDSGAQLAVDLTNAEEDDYVTDPAVSVHPAGASQGYVMVYVTGIP